VTDAIRTRAALSRSEVEALGRYNAEVARGLSHTPGHKAMMADLQDRFRKEAGTRVEMGQGRGYRLVKHIQFGRLGRRLRVSIFIHRRFGEWK